MSLIKDLAIGTALFIGLVMLLSFVFWLFLTPVDTVHGLAPAGQPSNKD